MVVQAVAYAGPFVESGQAALEVPPTTTRYTTTGDQGWFHELPRVVCCSQEHKGKLVVEYPLLPLLMKPFAGEIGTSQVH